MIRVAWVAAHPLFEGVIGGAEMADEDMINAAPKNVTVAYFPEYNPGIVEYDRVVVTRPENHSKHEIRRLADLSPIVWPHGAMWQVGQHARPLLQAASKFIALTPMHLDREMQWLNLNGMPKHYNPGCMDLTGIHEAEKEDFAIWPHRPVSHKGLDRALEWSNEKGIELIPVWDKPRNEMLEIMARAQYFVLLSHIFDAGPRTVIEAQLSGCSLVIDNVGYYDESKEELKLRMENAADDFWRVVCESL